MGSVRRPSQRGGARIGLDNVYPASPGTGQFCWRAVCVRAKGRQLAVLLRRIAVLGVREEVLRQISEVMKTSEIHSQGLRGERKSLLAALVAMIDSQATAHRVLGTVMEHPRRRL